MAARAKEETADPMTIVVAIRIGEGSKAALAAAVRLTSQLGGRLHLVYVASELEAVSDLAEAAGQSEEEARSRMLDEIRQRCLAEFGDPFPGGAELLIQDGREGKLADGVRDAALHLGADLIVVGMKGRSALARLVLGDTTGSILENAPCPVVVIPPAISNPAG
jgi:nucleotide-binding universal stress UspA family protein